MTIHATFTKKLARVQNRDDRFLSLFGRDGQLDLSALNVKHRFRDVALRKHGLVLVKFNNRLAHAHLGEEVLGIKHFGRWLRGHLSTVWLQHWILTPLSPVAISTSRSRT